MSDASKLLPKPAAYQYRWKIDDEWVKWRYADYSQASIHLKGFEERSLYYEDTIPAMLIEAERRGMMRAIKILELRPTRTERLGGQKFKYIQLGESIEEIRQAAAELETK